MEYMFKARRIFAPSSAGMEFCALYTSENRWKPGPKLQATTVFIVCILPNIDASLASVAFRAIISQQKQLSN